MDHLERDNSNFAWWRALTIQGFQPFFREVLFNKGLASKLAGYVLSLLFPLARLAIFGQC